MKLFKEVIKSVKAGSRSVPLTLASKIRLELNISADSVFKDAVKYIDAIEEIKFCAAMAAGIMLIVMSFYGMALFSSVNYVPSIVIRIGGLFLSLASYFAIKAFYYFFVVIYPTRRKYRSVD